VRYDFVLLKLYTYEKHRLESHRYNFLNRHKKQLPVIKAKVDKSFKANRVWSKAIKEVLKK